MSEERIDFYSAEPDAENVTADDVSEAIIDAIDQWDRKPKADDTIEVTAYRLMELPSREKLAQAIIDHVVDILVDEYAHPSGEYGDELDPEKVMPDALAFADAVRRHYKVRACQRLHTWTERVGDHVPAEWLEEQE